MSVGDPSETGLADRGADASPTTGRLLAIVFIAVAALIHYLLAAAGGPVLRDGGLFDSDSYMRVLRIVDLYNGAGWYDTMTARLGAPEGLSLHWTRPVDLLILLPALVAHAFGADLSRAVYWIGAGFSPFCHILACLAAVWAARPLWPSPWHRFAAAILLANMAAFAYSVFGRADHHALLLLLTVLMLGAALRACLGVRLGYWARLAGLFAGLGVWISPEMMVPIVPVIGAFGLFWLIDAERRDWATAGTGFSLAMAAVAALAIPIEQPPSHWTVAEYDKISLPYLALPLVWAAVFAVAGRVKGGIGRRIAAGVMLGAIGLGLLFAVFPGLFQGPMGDLSLRAKRDFLDNVREMQPLWPTDLDRLGTFLLMAGQSIAALLLLPAALRTWRRDQRRMPGLLLAIAFFFLLGAALLHTRLAVEFAATTALICGGFLGWAAMKLQRASRLVRAPGLVLIAIGLTYAPLAASFAMPQNPKPAACKLADLAAWMTAAHPGRGDSPIVMTDDFSDGSELAFRTSYRFVAGPYHRNPQAIFDTIDAMTDTGGDAARAIFERRQVSLVVRCTRVNLPQLSQAGEQTLYAKLARGTPPDWLRPLALPAGLAGDFKVYEVEGR